MVYCDQPTYGTKQFMISLECLLRFFLSMYTRASPTRCRFPSHPLLSSTNKKVGLNYLCIWNNYFQVREALERYLFYWLRAMGAGVMSTVLPLPPEIKKTSKKYITGECQGLPQPTKTEFNLKVRWKKVEERGYACVAPLHFSHRVFLPFRGLGVWIIEKKELEGK